MTPIQSTAQILQQAHAGQRLWFCLCPSAEPMLLVTSLKADPDMKALWSQILSTFPDDAPMSHGVAHMSRDGRLRLMAPDFSADTLPRLAGWVKANAATHPGLKAVVNPTLLTIDRSGEVRSTQTRPDLWQGLSAATVSGSQAETEALLEGLKHGRRLWFWMTDAGIGGDPTLLCMPQKTDKDGAAFAEACLKLVRRMPGIGQAINGLILKTDIDRLAVVSEAPEAQLRVVCSAVAARHPALSGALIVSTAGVEGEAPLASLDDLDNLMAFDF